MKTHCTPFNPDDKEPLVLSSESVHEDDSEEETIHAVVFKCIGVNKGESGCKIQKVLQEIAEKQRNGENVNVCVNREPENPFVPNAVVFQALVEGK